MGGSHQGSSPRNANQITTTTPTMNTMNTPTAEASTPATHTEGASLNTNDTAGATPEARLSFWKAQAQEWKAEAEHNKREAELISADLEYKREEYKYKCEECNTLKMRLDTARTQAEGKGDDLKRATAEILDLRKQLKEAKEAAQAKEAAGTAARPQWDEYQPQSHAEAELITRLKWNKAPMPTAEEAQTMCAIFGEIFWDFDENTRELDEMNEIATNITRALAIIKGEEVLRAALDAVKIPDYIRERGTRALDMARTTALEICEAVDDRENIANLSAFFDVLKTIAKKGGQGQHASN